MSKKKIRSKFNADVLGRDNFKCKLCGRWDVKLDAHHITNRNEFENGGYIKSNGISLCDDGENGCHFKVEKFYFSDGIINDLDNQYHPNNLYKLIDSSFEKAKGDDLKLAPACGHTD